VVWSRLHWGQRDPEAPTALVLEYVNMAGEFRLNGGAIWRDASLVEPLTRSWNMPRYFVLSPPLLRAGTNTLLVRISGLAAYQPGLGPVRVGPQADLHHDFQRTQFLRRDFKLASMAMQFALGSFFVVLWLLRRREVAFGWFGVYTMVWIAFTWNQVATSPWPFADTHDYQAVVACLYAVFAGCFAMFVLRFFARHAPRAERGLWVAIGVAVAALLAAPPPYKGIAIGLAVLAASVFIILACGLFAWLAWRSRETEQRTLGAVFALYLVVGVHDLLVYFQVLDSNMYYTDITVFITTIGVAGVLAWRYTRSLRRIENFSIELGQEVAQARNNLAAHLRQQHQLEVSHARVGERLNLVRDLHDGLGGTLTGSIAAIEHTPGQVSGPQLLKVLKQLRDDLRLIIDASAAHPQGGGSLEEQLIPLRHRMTRLLDANGIDCRWELEGVDALNLSPSQTLDVLRFVQEALANVLAHSGASDVLVRVGYAAPRLAIEVRDNGRGLSGAAGAGAGMQSMQARARRLGGEFRFEPAPGATRASMDAEIAA
jgi:signal transduction histidine kinase